MAKKATASEQAAQERAAANAAAEATIPTMASQRFNTAFKAAADKLPEKIKGDKQWYVLSETTLQPLKEARDRAEGHRRANPRSALAARRAKLAWRVFKKATAKAKERWVLSKCTKLNHRETTHGAGLRSAWGGIQGGAAWKAIRDIVRGLSKVTKSKPMQRSTTWRRAEVGGIWSKITHGEWNGCGQARGRGAGHSVLSMPGGAGPAGFGPLYSYTRIGHI